MKITGLWAISISCLLVISWRGMNAQENENLTNLTGVSRIHREGLSIEQQVADFRPDNDRLVAKFAHENKPIQVLENLAAQRILRAYREDPDDSHWIISGRLTEFESRNYLLIERITRAGRNRSQ